VSNILEIIFGAHSDNIYRIAYESTCLPFLIRNAEQFPDLVSECVRRLATELNILGSGVSFVGIKRAIAALDAQQPDYSVLADSAKSLLEELDGWLLNVVPFDEQAPVPEAKRLVHVDRFRGYWLPIDSARIDAFVQQFPPSLRWVGNAILDAVEFYDERFFTNALSSLIQLQNWWGRDDVALCLLGGARKSGARMSYLLRRDLKLSYHELRAVLLPQSQVRTIVFLDDCLVTGTQAWHIFSELLGIWNRPPKYEPTALSATELACLRERRIVLAAALGTDFARHRLNEFFRSQGIDHEVRFARTVPLLSESGVADLAEQRLFDASKSLNDPVRQLADPIFCPWARIDHPERWKEARDFCNDVGYALLEPISAASGWSDDRRRGSGLGYSGLQGKLVFSHNVPRSTLTLLWAPGVYGGRSWVPLFPARE